MSELNETNVTNKISERFNRYYKDIKQLKKIINKGFKTEEDFKAFYEKYNDIEFKHDYSNVKYYIDHLEQFKKMLTYTF